MTSATSIERHFNIMIILMLTFLVIDLSTDALIAFKIIEMKIGDSHAHSAFMACFGIALGIFRAMKPEN